jgi:hypothetical protein
MNDDWNEQGAHSFAEARDPQVFVKQHVAPLLGQRACHPEMKGKEGPSQRQRREFRDEEEFWREACEITFRSVRLSQFRLSDWFPRTPGVYWSQYGIMTRENIYSNRTTVDPKLGRIYAPQSKMSLIEEGGVGTIRLRPRRIDGTDCWFATAVKGSQCAGGIPLLVPHRFISEGAIEWGDTVNVVGTVRFLQDASLEDVAAYVHHASPVIIFVEEIEVLSPKKRSAEITITPVALFDQPLAVGSQDPYRRRVDCGYTFVQSVSDHRQLSEAAEWIKLYAEKHGGRILTNFDERSPLLADAPLSYQRLVEKTYDRTIIANFHLEKLADRIDSVSTEYINYGQVAAMGEQARSDKNIFWRGRDRDEG